MLDDKTTIEYIRRAKLGEEKAKETLIEHNVSLVKCIVKRYLGKGVDYDDLFQIACMGFLKAIMGFDEKFGVKFSTYAVPMIAGEIKRFMRDDGSVKVSRAMKQTAKEINAFIEEYVLKTGQQPAIAEIAKQFGMDEAETVFTMVVYWNDWFTALIYLGGKGSPLPLVMRNILIKSSASASQAATISGGYAELNKLTELLKFCSMIVAAVPMLVIYPFVQKYFEKGFMAGAVKG